MNFDRVFADDGPLSVLLPGYKARAGQLKMLRSVSELLARRFQEEGARHLIVEAGCGVGKSLAYGIPAAADALAGDAAGVQRTVLIVTANIALQEQLVGKDLPLIARLFEQQTGERLRFMLVKGFSNYLCRLKLAEQLNETRQGRPSWLQEIERWSRLTQTGDKSELPEEVPEWREVSTTSRQCLGKACPEREECFALRARRSEPPPHIVVTNYHMFYAHLKVVVLTEGFGGILPLQEDSLVVFDEAHEAADIAQEVFGAELTLPSLRWAAALLDNLPERAAYKAQFIDQCTALHEELGEQIAAFFSQLARRAQDRIVKQSLGPEADLGLIELFTEAEAAYREALSKLGVEEEPTLGANAGGRPMVKDGPRCDPRVIAGARLKQRAELCAEHRTELRNLCQRVEELADRVYYLEPTDNPQIVEVHCKNMGVGDLLQEELFSKNSVVMTSATLSVDGGFHFVAQRLGLRDGDYAEEICPSPFDPARSLIYIPQQFPDPSSPQFPGACADEMGRVLRELDGRSMCLFTSYRNLNAVYERLSRTCPGMRFLVQGKLTKRAIIERFTETQGRGRVILATSSFWQGVDLPGDQLVCVMIDKLPFARPDDPVGYYVDRQGGSGFMDHSLPNAVIALKQGAGRLIRRETDYGAICLFDRRIQTKPYGGRVMSAFADGCLVSDQLADVWKFIHHMEKENARDSP